MKQTSGTLHLRFICGITLLVSAIAYPSIAAGQNVTLSPLTLPFGNVVENTTSAAKKITLNNGGSVALTIATISATPSNYVVTSTNCPLSPSTLRAGLSCTIYLSFTPVALGSVTGTLSVTDNASNSPQTVSLNGTGVAPVALSPTGIFFGSQIQGTTSAPQSIKLTNNQTIAVSIGTISSSVLDFAASSTCPMSPSTLAAGSSCSIDVTFTPQGTGTRALAQ